MLGPLVAARRVTCPQPARVHGARGARHRRRVGAAPAMAAPRQLPTHFGPRDRALAVLLVCLCFGAACQLGARADGTIPVSAAGRAALLDFFNATNGPQWFNSANWGVGDPCINNWHGIFCRNATHQGIAVDLDHNSLVGTLPPSFRGLAADLGDLDLGANALTGEIPDIWSDFKRLVHFEVYGNAFYGTIPPSLCDTPIGDLSLHENHLNGSLPDCMYRMRELETIRVTGNQLTGNIPSVCTGVVGGLPPKLTRLDLHGQRFTGWDTSTRCHPEEVSHALSTLDVQGNNITVHLYSNYMRQLFKFLPLVFLAIDNNPGISVSLEDLAKTPVSLLSLAHSGATGELADSFVRVPYVQLVATGCRGITGSLPSFLEFGLPFIRYLDVRGTSMRHDSLPAWLTSGAPQFVNNKTAACETVDSIPPGAVTVLLDFGYDDYARCYCLPGFAGSVKTACQPCRPGFYSDTGASTCASCPAGTTQPVSSKRDGRFTCEPCADATFSRPATSGSPHDCFSCPAGVTCSAGAFAIEDGYWWPGELQLLPNTTLLPCLSAEACPAPQLSTEGILAHCPTGSLPPLCAVCAPEYSRLHSVCTRCPSGTVNAIMVAAALLATFLFVNLSMFRRAAARHRAAKASPGGFSARDSGRTGATGGRGAFRTLVTFMQLTALASQFGLGSTAGGGVVHAALSEIAGTIGDGWAHVLSSPLSCSFTGVRYPQVVFAAAALPVAMPFVSLLWVVLARILCSSRLSALPFWHDVVASAVGLFFLIYSRITHVAFAALKEYPYVINGTTYLQADFRVTPQSAEFVPMQATAAGMLLLYTIVAPAAAFVALGGWMRRETAPDVGGIYAPLYESERQDVARQPSPFALLLRGYQRRVWWWEATIVGRKVIFAALVVFIEDATAQALLACLVLMMLLALQLHQRPYTDDALNFADAFALFALFVTRIGHLASAYVGGPTGLAGGSVAFTVVQVAVAAVNAVALLALLRLCLRDACSTRWCAGKSSRVGAPGMSSRFENGSEIDLRPRGSSDADRAL